MTETSPMPDAFDRLLGEFEGLPGVVQTRPVTIQVVPPLGIGGSEVFVLSMARQRDLGDYVFLRYIGPQAESPALAGAIKLVLPPRVMATIARQQKTMEGMARRKAARAIAADRKQRGEPPAFSRRKETS